MFFAKKYGFLIVKRAGVSVWNEKQLLGEISFPQESLRNMEVVDRQSFGNGLIAGLQPLLASGSRLLVLLCDEVVFSKVATNNDYATQMNEFRNLMPFKTEAVEAKMVEVDARRYLVGVNKSLISVINDVLTQAKYKVIASLPMMVFHRKGGAEAVSEEFLKDVLSNQGLFKVLSFS